MSVQLKIKEIEQRTRDALIAQEKRAKAVGDKFWEAQQLEELTFFQRKDNLLFRSRQCRFLRSHTSIATSSGRSRQCRFLKKYNNSTYITQHER